MYYEIAQTNNLLLFVTRAFIANFVAVIEAG